MLPLLYRDLVSWYRLVDPPAEHEEEAALYAAALQRAAWPPPETLLELGAGAGHNASHLKKRFRCTLTDLSDDMLGLSRELNPECEHVAGDMRSLRLGRAFDLVLVHDAIQYMTREEDLAAAAHTAFAHTRTGGAALFAPDYVRETFRETATLLEGAEGGRALRGVEWTWDPDPSDQTFVSEYGLILRDGLDVRAAHDRHLEGLFARATWREILEGVGFRVELVDRTLEDWTADQIFVCRRPGSRPLR